MCLLNTYNVIFIFLLTECTSTMDGAGDYRENTSLNIKNLIFFPTNAIKNESISSVQTSKNILPSISNRNRMTIMRQLDSFLIAISRIGYQAPERNFISVDNKERYSEIRVKREDRFKNERNIRKQHQDGTIEFSYSSQEGLSRTDRDFSVEDDVQPQPLSKNEGRKETQDKNIELKHVKVKRTYKKYLLPLLLAYKLKFFTLIPVLIGGLVLLAGSTGMAGFFFALFAAVISIKASQHHHHR